MKLSVAMCTYNGEKFIKEQLNSILNQSQNVDEIIICDDGSVDSTISIIKEYQLKYPTIIKLYQNETNLKVNKNFEKAISLTSGDYIFLSDQDDIWDKYKTEKIISIFNKNKGIEGVFSNATIIDEKSIKIPEMDLWKSVGFDENRLNKPIDLYKLLKNYKNVVTGATLCFKKEIKNILLPIPKISGFFHDEWIALILANRKSLFYSTENLISYRTHSNQQVGINNTKKNDVLLFIHGELNPSSAKEQRSLSKLSYNNYHRFKNISTLNSTIDFNKISNENLALYLLSENKLKKKHYFTYLVYKIIDKIRKKRQVY